MKSFEDEVGGGIHKKVQLEPLASLSVHPTLRVVVQGAPDAQQVNAEVVSMKLREGSADLEDVVIRISDVSLTPSDKEDPIGYDWEALAEFPEPGPQSPN
jgi:hypothetical protein